MATLRPFEVWWSQEATQGSSARLQTLRWDNWQTRDIVFLVLSGVTSRQSSVRTTESPRVETPDGTFYSICSAS